jgi:polyphenol oxidase
MDLQPRLVGMLQSSLIAADDRLVHAFFTRNGGVSEGIYRSLNGGLGSKDASDRVRENRARMAAALGLSATHLVTAYQIHSAEVAIAHEPWTRETAPRADALVTRRPGLAIGITTADCGPVLLADAEAGIVAAAHAGWRGALDGIIEATVSAMERLGAQRARVVAALGPAIRQPNYEVGREFMVRFVTAHRDNDRFFVPSGREGHAMFDLPGYIVAQLMRARVGRIDELARCTYGSSSQFFSFRRAAHRSEPDYGRHVSAIALRA